MKAEFHKISIDFEYLNEIYTINSDPYNTLSELKDIVSKKIYPSPENVHCFYKNIDLSEKEDEEIAKLFPHFSKIKIKLKHPPKEKSIRRSILSTKPKPILKTLESILKKRHPNIEAIVSPESKSKTIRKSKFKRLIPLPLLTTKRNQSPRIHEKIREKTVNNVDNHELLDLLNDNGIDSYKTFKKDKEKKEKEIKRQDFDEFLNKFKISKNINFMTYKKEVKNLNLFLSNLKGKSLNKLKFPNNISLNFTKDKTFDNKNEKSVNKTSNKKLKALNLSLEERSIKDDNNDEKLNDKEEQNNNKPNSKIKGIIDENYKCSSCLSDIISSYCFNCNQFKCEDCKELCKIDEHKFIQIELKANCINNITTFGELIISNIDKNLEEISKYNKEIQVYDIAKYKSNLINHFNEILILYSEIINILQNIHKEKQRTKEINKFERESNKIKNEINEILKNANSYLKNDEDISKPKYKMMNMKYFFDLLNEKGKAYNSINNSMKKYALNLTINANIEKSFKEIDNIIKSFSNAGNPFSLEDDLNHEYQKLLHIDNNSKNDKKKLFMKRKTLSVKSVNLLHFPKMVAEKNTDLDLNNSGLLDT